VERTLISCGVAADTLVAVVADTLVVVGAGKWVVGMHFLCVACALAVVVVVVAERELLRS